MAYCDRTGLSPDHACGRDGTRFYTQTRELRPGDEWESPWHSIEAEVCPIDRSGTPPFDPDGWDGRGGFRCQAEKAERRGTAPGGIGIRDAGDNRCMERTVDPETSWTILWNRCDYPLHAHYCIDPASVTAEGRDGLAGYFCLGDGEYYYNYSEEIDPGEGWWVAYRLPETAVIEVAACRYYPPARAGPFQYGWSFDGTGRSSTATATSGAENPNDWPGDCRRPALLVQG